jgi:protein CpxP
MTRTRVLTAAIAGVCAIAIGTAFAQGPRGGGPRRGGVGPGGPGAGLVLRGLDLSDAQEDQVRAVRERYREQAREAAQRLAESRRAQREAIQALPANEGLVISATQNMVQAEIDVAVLQSRVYTEVWGVLTPEQQSQVTARRAQRDDTLGERRERLEERRQQRRPAQPL